MSISGQNSWLEAEGHQAVVTSGRMRLEAASAVSSAGPAGPKACLRVAVVEVGRGVGVVEVAAPEQVGDGEFGGVEILHGDGLNRIRWEQTGTSEIPDCAPE